MFCSQLSTVFSKVASFPYAEIFLNPSQDLTMFDVLIYSHHLTIFVKHSKMDKNKEETSDPMLDPSLRLKKL